MTHPDEHTDIKSAQLMLQAEIAALGQIESDVRALIAAELAALDTPEKEE
jgi:hypothetical protein